MQITRNGLETTRGPSDWFTGSVYVDTVAAPSGGSRISASRRPWPLPAARRPDRSYPPGDRVFFEPGEDHWHGAAPNCFMTHIAMLEVDPEATRRPGASTSAARVRGRAVAR